MKEKRIEEVSYKTVYVAVDGTEFVSRDECLKYDRSAEAIIKSRIKDAKIRSMDEESLFCCGSCENEVIVYFPKSKEDVENLKHLILLTNESSSVADKVTDDYINNVVFLTKTYDGYYYVDDMKSLIKRALGDKFEFTISVPE